MESSLLFSAGLATLALVAVLFVAAALLRSWRREMGGRESSERSGSSLEAIYREFMAKRGAPGAAQARTGQDSTRAQLADAEGLLARLRRDAAETGAELTRTILEAEAELGRIRACLNRGDVTAARDRAQSLTLRLAGEIARRPLGA